MHFGMRLYFSTLFRKHQNQKTTPFQQQVRTPESQEGTASKPDLNIMWSNFKERNAVQKSNATAAISNRHPPNVFTTAMSCVCPFQFLCHPLRSGALAQPQSSAAHLVVNDLKGPTREQWMWARGSSGVSRPATEVGQSVFCFVVDRDSRLSLAGV